MMRKLILLAAMLALAVMATAPALAKEILSVEPETTTIDAPPVEAPVPPPPVEIPPAPPEEAPEEAPAPLPEAPAPPPPAVEDVVEDTSAGKAVEPEATPVQDTGARAADSGNSGNDNSENNQGAVVEDTGDNDKDDGGAAAKDSGDEKAGSGGGKAKDDKDDEKGSGKDDDEDEDDIEQDSDQDADSGDVDQDINIINTGDNVNLCIGIIQAVNTGNIQDSDQIAQEDSEAEEVELEDGSSISVTPQLIVDCRQIIYQIVTGEDSDGSKDKVSKTGASKLAKTKIDLKSTYFTNSARNSSAQPGVRTAGAGTRVISNRSDARAAQQPNASRRALPRTGGIPIGYAAILGLSIGAPLVGGGLLLRRISR